MTSYIGQIGALGRVRCPVVQRVEGGGRGTELRWSPGGQVGGRRSAHRRPRTWTVDVPVTDGASVHPFHLAKEGLLDPCVWVPADAVGGNCSPLSRSPDAAMAVGCSCGRTR